jgi:hypothetical protein
MKPLNRRQGLQVRLSMAGFRNIDVLNKDLYRAGKNGVPIPLGGY